MLRGKKPEWQDISQFEQVEDSGCKARASQAEQAQEQKAQLLTQFDY